MAPRKAKKNQDDVGDDGDSGSNPEEQRKSPYRTNPNDHYDADMEKVNSERMFILKVNDSGEYGDLAKSFVIKGSSGSVYTVKISNNLKRSCTCQSAVSI